MVTRKKKAYCCEKPVIIAPIAASMVDAANTVLRLKRSARIPHKKTLIVSTPRLTAVRYPSALSESFSAIWMDTNMELRICDSVKSKNCAKDMILIARLPFLVFRGRTFAVAACPACKESDLIVDSGMM